MVLQPPGKAAHPPAPSRLRLPAGRGGHGGAGAAPGPELAAAHLLNSIIMAMVMMLFVTRNSALRAHKRWLYGLGTSAIVFEVIWLASMV